MIGYIYSLSSTTLFLIISIFVLGISIASTLIIRRFVSLKELYTANSGLSRVNSGTCTIYSILVGFAVFYLFSNFHDAELATSKEIKALNNINSYVQNVSEPTRSMIKKDLKEYIEIVLDKDWKSMSKGESVSNQSKVPIEKLWTTLYSWTPETIKEKKVIDDLLDEIKNLSDYREERIQMAGKFLEPEFWAVIILISFLMLEVSCMTGLRVDFHLISSVITALVISCALFLMITLDRPFSGSVSISNTSFQKIASSL